MFKSDKNLGIPKSVIEEMAKALEEMKMKKMSKESKDATHPKTDKEKKLAAMAEPKDKITHKDVLVARGVIKEDELEEKHLTPAEMKKREEIAKAMERDNPGMDKSKKMAIATAQAKKVAEETEELDEKYTAKQKALKLGAQLGHSSPYGSVEPYAKRLMNNPSAHDREQAKKVRSGGRAHAAVKHMEKHKGLGAAFDRGVKAGANMRRAEVKTHVDSINKDMERKRKVKSMRSEEIDLENFILFHIEEGYELNDIISYIEENYIVEAEQLDEISNKMRSNYIGKAASDASQKAKQAGMTDDKSQVKKVSNRLGFIHKAAHKMNPSDPAKANKITNAAVKASNDSHSVGTHQARGWSDRSDTKKAENRVKKNLSAVKKLAKEEINIEDFINYHLEEGYDINDIISYIEENYIVEAEQLDEIGDTPAGKKALGNYINKAAGKLHKSSYMIAKDKPENANKHGNDAYNRRVGILRATSKLTKEDVLSDEELARLEEIAKNLD